MIPGPKWSWCAFLALPCPTKHRNSWQLSLTCSRSHLWHNASLAENLFLSTTKIWSAKILGNSDLRLLVFSGHVHNPANQAVCDKDVFFFGASVSSPGADIVPVANRFHLPRDNGLLCGCALLCHSHQSYLCRALILSESSVVVARMYLRNRKSSLGGCKGDNKNWKQKTKHPRHDQNMVSRTNIRDYFRL